MGPAVRLAGGMSSRAWPLCKTSIKRKCLYYAVSLSTQVLGIYALYNISSNSRLQ
jgi:hypothetical protein